jgi:carbon-monoxide dehydrogenase large subunit
MAAAAPVLRDDLAGKTSGAHGPRRHHNHIFTWEVGDATGTASMCLKIGVGGYLSWSRSVVSPSSGANAHM